MRRVLFALFGTVAGMVVLLGFKTHTAAPAGLPAAVSTAGPAGGTSGTPSTSPPPATSSSKGTSSGSGAAKSSSAASASKTVTGDAVDTRWGPVQVKITVTNGKVTSAQAVVYPWNNPRDQEINSFAIPALNQEAVSSGSARIDSISGATVTSGGYISSLQSALDKAGG